MKALQFSFGTAVFVQWEDSAQVDGWRREAEVDVGLIESCGYVVACSEKGLTISAAISDQNSCICPLSIPWSCVTNIREICETKPPEVGSNEANGKLDDEPLARVASEMVV